MNLLHLAIVPIHDEVPRLPTHENAQNQQISARKSSGSHQTSEITNHQCRRIVTCYGLGEVRGPNKERSQDVRMLLGESRKKKKGGAEKALRRLKFMCDIGLFMGVGEEN